MNDVIIEQSQNEIATLIKQRRSELKISQRSLAKMAGTTQTAISNIEMCATNPTHKTLVQIASVLGMELKLQLKDRINEKRNYY